LAGWEAFCGELVKLFAVWDTVLLPSIESRDSFRVDTEAEHPQLASSEAWNRAVESPVRPVPASFDIAFSDGLERRR
jgi:hypothetical protein